jgi:hypothetical protein
MSQGKSPNCPEPAPCQLGTATLPNVSFPKSANPSPLLFQSAPLLLFTEEPELPILCPLLTPLQGEESLLLAKGNTTCLNLQGAHSDRYPLLYLHLTSWLLPLLKTWWKLQHPKAAMADFPRSCSLHHPSRFTSPTKNHVCTWSLLTASLLLFTPHCSAVWPRSPPTPPLTPLPLVSSIFLISTSRSCVAWLLCVIRSFRTFFFAVLEPFLPPNLLAVFTLACYMVEGLRCLLWIALIITLQDLSKDSLLGIARVVGRILTLWPDNSKLNPSSVNGGAWARLSPSLRADFLI